MHPFCLPFGFCHDATSSSVAAADFAATVQNQNNSDQNSTKISNNPDRKDRLRSRTSSPSDELFRYLYNEAPSSNCHQSLLEDDLIIGSSPSLDLNADESFYSLELGIDIDANILHHSNNETGVGFTTDDDPEDLKAGGDDDWLSSQYSLLSPTSAHQLRRKSIIRTASLLPGYNNQVFQHVVDPVDIKSSPTLAQLNLNSNDDPTEGLWDTPNTQSALANTDLLSNCTSIISNVSNLQGSNTVESNNDTNCGNNNNNTSICHHLQHHHSHTNHHTHDNNIPSYAHLDQVSSSLASCPHVHYHHHHHHHQQQMLQQSASTQSTCLAVTPFKKHDPHHHPCSLCCHNLLATTTNSLNQNLINEQNLRPSATLNQLNLLAHSTDSTALSSISQITSIEKQDQKSVSQRSASPALVTSSSSPLSSNINGPNDARLIDNKLKENIEYLTALLCNGNRFENHTNQQPTISSTMVRSYATLAQSLATGPKLLERQQVPMPVPIAYQQKDPSSNIPSNPTNEAAPSVDCSNHAGIQLLPNPLKRPYSENWFKSTVETNISVADSTEGQVSSGTNCERVHQNQMNSILCSNHQLSLSNPARTPELKVLSSLLNASKCPDQNCSIIHNRNQQTHGCASWPDNSGCDLQEFKGSAANTNELPTVHPLNQAELQPKQTDQEPISVPANGKPITLTPIANQNNLIFQHSKPRVSLFAQPASPSASSTTSSGGNTDVGSSIPPTTALKRQRSGEPQTTNQKVVNNTKRTNSISNDCSQSSHDEGFSSQIDNDECGSVRDSDEDDVLDSDDESFYGDYTNNDLIGASISDDVENKWTLNMGRTRRNGQKRYFWQYNVQSKGPKGTRICSTDDSEDPFVLPEASDPVFSNDCQIEGVKHSGKARRGDGNDLTPNPKKLLMIGLELKKLGKIITELAPVTDLPVNARNKTRKEKNKLASRACRLKKKAQHEANKIKLYGLQREHQQVVLAIYDIRKLLNQALLESDVKELAKKQQPQPPKQPQLNLNNQDLAPGDDLLSSKVNSMAEQCSLKVAGRTSDYVNSVLEKVVSGCIDGGLQPN